MRAAERLKTLILNVRTYGILETSRRAIGFARRNIYSKLIPAVIAARLPYEGMALSIWRDQSDDRTGEEIFSSLLALNAKCRSSPVRLAVPNYLVPVFGYLHGLVHRDSRVISYDGLKENLDFLPEIVILNRLTMGPLSEWFAAHGQSYRCFRQNNEYALLVLFGLKGMESLDHDLVDLQPAFMDTFVDAANDQYQSHGLTFNVRPHTTDRLLVQETWQAYIEWLAEKGIYTADRVLDLGAHIGGFSLHAARHLCSTKIISIEAAPQNYEMLERNIAVNQLTDIVTPIWSAALDRDGVVPLSISSDHTGVHKVEHGLPTSKEVPALDVARIFDECGPITLLKIDIEGSEIPVLQRLADRLKKLPVVIGELHSSPFGGPEKAIKILEDAGFDVEVRGDAKIPAFLAVKRPS